ncbi:hypothetical protein [Streptosporangium lutulentum]|uniref:EF-hand domain-containing protein n=1 Tax=Streptosporangium lutulentum TaxID=1461250 RepID=A0ABT9Q9D4_9ACTN|nr:hypothetical protein [Streptosporangium lutulentum]MDP9843329.1 hypothetical protein [Streptosporangium lutulentum]
MSGDASGYITRDEIAQVVGLLLVRPGEPAELAETVDVDATTVNGEHENPLTLYRACVKIQEILDQAKKDAKHYEGTWQDHMPYRPELFAVEYADDYDFDKNEGGQEYSYIEDADEAEDRSVALGIVQKLVDRFNIEWAEVEPC